MELKDLFDQQTLDAILADAKEAGIDAADVEKVLNTLPNGGKATPTRGADPEAELMSLMGDNKDDVTASVASAGSAASSVPASAATASSAGASSADAWTLPALSAAEAAGAWLPQPAIIPSSIASTSSKGSMDFFFIGFLLSVACLYSAAA